MCTTGGCETVQTLRRSIQTRHPSRLILLSRSLSCSAVKDPWTDLVPRRDGPLVRVRRRRRDPVIVAGMPCAWCRISNGQRLGRGMWEIPGTVGCAERDCCVHGIAVFHRDVRHGSNCRVGEGCAVNRCLVCILALGIKLLPILGRIVDIGLQIASSAAVRADEDRILRR